MDISIPSGSQGNPLSEISDNCVPPFIGAHLRRPTVRESVHVSSSQHVHYEASESMSTITVDHHHSQVFDMVIDSQSRNEIVSRIDDLWSQLQQALFSRLEFAREAALITVGPSKSGKSSLLFGEEVDMESPKVGLVPRFVRTVFEEGMKGDIPSAVEVSILHVEDEDMYDLLHPPPMEPVITQESKKLLKLRWSKTCGTYVENVSRSVASSLDEFLTFFREAMAMRALLLLHSGRNVDAHACHLVVTISLLAASANKTVVIPRSTITFIELGDALSMHSHAIEQAHADRLSYLTNAERSRVELMKCVATLADMNEDEEQEFDPQALPSELFQKSTLTYLLHGPLTKGTTVWMGCFSPVMSKESAPAVSSCLALLDNARRMHTVAAVRQSHSKKSKHNELVAGVLEEISTVERFLEELQSNDESRDGKEWEVASMKSQALQTLSEHLESSLVQRVAMTDVWSSERQQLIATSGLSLFREKRLPDQFIGDASDLNSLDLATGPFLSLQCCDHLSSGRLRVVLQEGPTILGREHQLPNVFINSQFVCDYHCACHNTSGNLELELLRENAEVYISGRLISNSNELGMDSSSAGGVDMMALEEGEEEGEELVKEEKGVTISDSGLPRLHHDDWIALTSCSACMFAVVYHEEIADKIRSGDLNPINKSRPSSVLEWNVEIFRKEAIEMLEQVEVSEEVGGKVTSETQVYEAARLLLAVAECNLLATFMDRDYLFEGQAKSFSFEGLSGYAAHSNHGVPPHMQDVHANAHAGAHRQSHMMQPRLSNMHMPRASTFASPHASSRPSARPSVFGSTSSSFSSHNRPSMMGGKNYDKTSEETGCSLWVFVDSVSDLVPDAYWTPTKLFARVSLIRKCYDFFIECGEDKDQLAGQYPAKVDPFYDIPTQKLIGVAYFYLNSINYLISVEETIPVVNFKGEVVGELDIEVVPVLESHMKAIQADMPIFQTEEANLRKLIGETLLLSVKMICARGLPRNLCAHAFSSFKFFLEEAPLRTGSCAARTTAPRWEQTMSLNLIINDDLVNYVVNEALEIELWGAPENQISSTSGDQSEQAVPISSMLCGEKIGEEEEEEEEAGTIDEGGATIDQANSTEELLKLKNQVQELKLEIEELQRENRNNGDLVLGLVKTFDSEAANNLKRERRGRVANAVKLSTEYILKLQGGTSGGGASSGFPSSGENGGKESSTGDRQRSLSPVAAIRRKLSKRASDLSNNSSENNKINKSEVCVVS